MALVYRGVPAGMQQAEEIVAATYGDLITCFPSDIQWVVLIAGSFGDAPRAAWNTSLSLSVGTGETRWVSIACVNTNTIPSFRSAAENQRQSRWIRDAFITLDDGLGIPVLLKPIESLLDAEENRSSYFTAEFFSLATGVLLKPFPYRVQGGDVLIGNDYALIGRRTLEMNMPVKGASSRGTEIRASIAQDFRKALGVREIVWIGGNGRESDDAMPEVPLYHIDYYLTLGGRNERGEELVFLGEITDESFLPGNEPGNRIAGELLRTHMNLYFDAVETHLMQVSSERGAIRFEVVRIPLILDYFRRGDLVVRSYNNCLIEVHGLVRNVYLPRYYENDGNGGNIFGPAEERVRPVFESRGFTVTMVEHNFTNLTRLNGSLRCMINVVGRNSNRTG